MKIPGRQHFSTESSTESVKATSKMKPRTTAYAILLAILLQGCSTSNYGYDKKDWDELSEGERNAIRAEYQPIIDEARQQKHGDLIDARTRSVIDYGVNGPRYGKGVTRPCSGTC